MVLCQNHQSEKIPTEEENFHLCQYVSRSVKKAIERFFLLGTESAQNAAWKILQERYGNQFLLAKAFRDKTWYTAKNKLKVKFGVSRVFWLSTKLQNSYFTNLRSQSISNENQKNACKTLRLAHINLKQKGHTSSKRKLHLSKFSPISKVNLMWSKSCLQSHNITPCIEAKWKWKDKVSEQ